MDRLINRNTRDREGSNRIGINPKEFENAHADIGNEEREQRKQTETDIVEWRMYNARLEDLQLDDTTERRT